MSAFANYYKSVTLEQSDEDDHFLLDMDSIFHRVTESPLLATRGMYGSTKKKCSLDDDETTTADGNGWSSKPIQNWTQEDTINWLMSAASHMGQPYGCIQHSLAVPGKELILMSRQAFLDNDPVYGNRLYDMLHSQRHSNLLPHFASLNSGSIESEDETIQLNSNNISDAESDNSVEVSSKRRPGRSRVSKIKKNVATSQGKKLWEFIRDLLRNRETCPSLICWEDYSQAKFRFVRSEEVAKRWGSRKGNTNMTYDKFSRALRYYYKSEIFQPVLSRLVYQFGPRAKGWQTDNPNFRR